MIRQGNNHINMRSEMNVTETCAFIYAKATTKAIDVRRAILEEKQTVVVLQVKIHTEILTLEIRCHKEDHSVHLREV